MTEFAEQDGLEVAERLISRTEQSALEWQVWQEGVYEYTASSARFRYYVKTRDDDGAAPYVLQIYRIPAVGAAVSDPLPNEELHSYPSSAYSEAIENLYWMARGKALGTENLKADILDDLDDE